MGKNAANHHPQSVRGAQDFQESVVPVSSCSGFFFLGSKKKKTFREPFCIYIYGRAELASGTTTEPGKLDKGGQMSILSIGGGQNDIFT